MAKTIYVGNLPYSITEQEISELFSPYGEVHNVKYIIDRETGKFRGFCFVEMENDDADAAVDNLDGSDFGGRTLRVNEARERKPFGGQRRG